MKRLYRSSTDCQISGLCGGIAKYFNIDSSLIRVSFVCLTLFAGMSLWVYIIGWLVIPEE